MRASRQAARGLMDPKVAAGVTVYIATHGPGSARSGPTFKRVIAGDRPDLEPTETNPARSKASRPREAENRERPNSAQASQASSKSADRSQPAKSQQTAATW